MVLGHIRDQSLCINWSNLQSSAYFRIPSSTFTTTSVPNFRNRLKFRLFSKNIPNVYSLRFLPISYWHFRDRFMWRWHASIIAAVMISLPPFSSHIYSRCAARNGWHTSVAHFEVNSSFEIVNSTRSHNASAQTVVCVYARVCVCTFPIVYKCCNCRRLDDNRLDS